MGVRWLDDLGQVEGEPPDAKERLAEVMADLHRRGRVDHGGANYDLTATEKRDYQTGRWLAGRPTCGTHAGYEWHRRHKQRACDDCKAAERDRQRRLRV